MVISTTKGKTTVTEAAPLEWEMQAASVRRLRGMPEFGDGFLLASDFNAGKRDAVKAKAMGITAGEPDLRIWLNKARVGLIEYKTATGKVSREQRDRHAAMAELGHTVKVVRAASCEECADETEKMVRGWLAANDNSSAGSEKGVDGLSETA